jgi:hypothetical protein
MQWEEDAPFRPQGHYQAIMAIMAIMAMAQNCRVSAVFSISQSI